MRNKHEDTMRWLVHAWTGKASDPGKIPALTTREDVLSAAKRVVGSFTLKIDTDSHIEGYGEHPSWFSALLLPENWTGEYDDGWFLDGPGDTCVFDYGDDGWLPCFTAKVPLEGNDDTDGADYPVRFELKRRASHLEAIRACERAHSSVAERQSRLGQQVVELILTSLRSAVDLAEEKEE